MAKYKERFFLYLDILGFKEMMKSEERLNELYEAIDSLNVHKDDAFKTIVFSDTILVVADEAWNAYPSKAIMWLVEFTQDLFYHLSHRNIHFRAIVTQGEFTYRSKKNFLSYHGKALVDCYQKEGTIKCCGTFLDQKLARHSTIFKLSHFDKDLCFVHLMQHLDDISYSYEQYPISGEYLLATGMEPWVAYLLRYLKIVHANANDHNLPSDVRIKFVMTWNMIAKRHDGLLRRLEEAQFDASKVVTLNWKPSEKLIGTDDGPWG